MQTIQSGHLALEDHAGEIAAHIRSFLAEKAGLHRKE